MKQTKQLFSLFLLLSSLIIHSQQTVKGTVTEKATGASLPGVSVIVKGQTRGAETDFDGNYTIDNIKPTDVLIFSFIGFATKEVTVGNQATINLALEESEQLLNEIVVVGYGTTTVKDATGSVEVVSSKKFNKGAIVSTDQLLTGKAAGVRITTNGGSPDSAPNIRIRGGSSLSAQNNPLIVIDGVAIGNDNPAGVSNPLTLINPNDIESFSILKDASATAIYGSRASNGVIIITTKQGSSGKTKFNFSSDISISNAGEGLDFMDGRQFYNFIEQNFPTRLGQLGVPVGSVNSNEQPIQIVNGRAIYNTNWREAILRTAITTNTNFSVGANLFDKIPFRGSVGYTKAQGIVQNDDYDRFTSSLKLTPKFLDDNLKVDVNAKTIFAEKNAISTDDVIRESLQFDPTKPIFNNSPTNRFGQYYLTTFDDAGKFRRIVQSNPLARLDQRDRPENVFRFLGNIEFDYTMPFLPELKAVLNLGLDASKSKVEETFSQNAFETYQFDTENDNINNNFLFNPGVNFRENQSVTNTTLDGYLKYEKVLEKGFINKYDIQAGYSYQNFKNDGTQDRFIYNNVTGVREAVVNPANPNFRYFNVLNLQSFFGRANISLLDRYLLTFSIRADGSSLFIKENRWGYFPAAALAWQIDEEDFLKDSNFVHNLKLRLGWGKTGQQDITGTVGFYPSIPLFLAGDNNSQYFPNSSIYSAQAFNPDLTWEKTSTYNLGLDFSLFKNQLLSGSFDIYKRFTTDLLAEVPIPPGQALTNAFVDNVGETESEGFELNINSTPVDTEDFTFSVGGNIAYNRTEVTNLDGIDKITVDDTDLRGTGTDLLSHAVGQQAGSASVFKQIYDTNGNPIPNAFVDINGDNKINDDDKFYKAIAPNWTYGFNLSFNYKNWDLTSNFRGQIGGYVYNFSQLNYGFLESAISSSQNNLTNVLDFNNGAANSVFSNVNGDAQFTDHYLEDATFLRLDNITLGHRFDNIIKNGTIRLYGSVMNPFIITNYTGLDPENFGGIDRNAYPRPTVYTFGINADF
ncbi:SusC/RagA family TonB-linked outer membrane protein [Tenacibaculum sp. M341]|uniref:SusC/RagA family TonB-linked outer membrane protein n=1 Tax=Tenacibaculum sp. M341 TaxID=2530339 RepID=UPI001048ED01|nr:SusC/RagA family TonB-linked outer membrane protein [Tenacibaculum sp. M341]TCI94936.1 SusC/RagA family TonB-linked outer membrane protein [Tenacibaculum sp. M341]